MNKWLIGLIVGIIFAALIISGVVVYLSKPKTEWKTYENKKWGFKFKYPAGWRIKEERSKGIPRGLFYVMFGTDALNCGFISVDNFPPSPCEEWIKIITPTEPSYKGGPSYKVLEWKNISLGGEPAIKVIREKINTTEKTVNICADHEGKQYEILFVSDKLDEISSQLNQIVESLEFI
jgi:hypothetical protein